MLKLLMIGAGGFVGAIARYLVSGLAHHFGGGTFPTGTLVVNVLGCLLIGTGMVFVEDRPLLGPHARLLLVTGMLGAFTTFSTFGYETVELLRDGELRPAMLNVAGNVVLGVGAVLLGRFLAKAVGV